MQARIYRIKKQELYYFCIPAVLQAVLRRRGLEDSQADIAREIGCTEEGAGFGGNLRDFLGERGLRLAFYNYNEVPFNDSYVLFSGFPEEDKDILVGFNRDLLHVHLATSFSDPLVSLLDPFTCKEEQYNIHQLSRKMFEDKSGGYALIETA